MWLRTGELDRGDIVGVIEEVAVSVLGGSCSSGGLLLWRGRTRRRPLRLSAVLAGALGVAVLAAGCGSDEPATPAPGPDPAPAAEAPPAEPPVEPLEREPDHVTPPEPPPEPPEFPAEPPQEGETEDATPPGEPPIEPPAEPPPAPEGEAEDAEPPAPPVEPLAPLPMPEPIPPDASDAYFALDRVLDIAIEIDTEDWDTLRNQTRTFEDLFAEIEEYGLSQPFAKIYTWFPATVTVDGETHTRVGVRKKGFIGSQSSTKPALKLRFDKYVDDQSLGGVMERMTLNNSVQDTSMINTCLALQIFAAAGNPASRCNFATVSVNGKNLGLYVHVEELKAPFLARHFDSADGNLYEGTISDFTPEFRGTIEKKNNEDADDWSDVDAVVAALADPSDAGWEALAAIVDLDRFLTYWATEVLVGHWDGYAGNRNNHQYYREPGGRFVFIPWGPDGTFHLDDDPNPFDNISDPPPSVLALTAIPNRLYNDDDWRARYVDRLKHLLDAVWHEDELLASVDQMAAIVQQHALPAERAEAAADTERVRQFIQKRRAELLDDLSPEPPPWPEPDFPAAGGDGGGLELTIRFESTWGSNESLNPVAQGEVLYVELNGAEAPTDDTAVIVGHASAEESAGFGDTPAASIAAFGVQPDGSVEGFTVVLPLAEFTGGAELVIGTDDIGGGVWTIPAGSATPDSFTPFTWGTLRLVEAGTSAGATVLGSFSGGFGGESVDRAGTAVSGAVSGRDVPGTAVSGAVSGRDAPAPADVGLVINEVASKGDPLDWFELYNASGEYLALANFVMADDLSDAGKRVAFPADLVIPPGGYLQVELDKEAWPGFALGGDEELGVWTADGALVDQVDWAEGEAGEGTSYARLPDGSGDFRTVTTPTPGAPNTPAG